MLAGTAVLDHFMQVPEPQTSAGQMIVDRGNGEWQHGTGRPAMRLHPLQPEAEFGNGCERTGRGHP